MASPMAAAEMVEQQIKQRHIDGAMNSLRDQLNGMSPSEKRATFNELKKMNEKDSLKDWGLPQVTITDEKSWGGWGSPTGNVNVDISQSGFQRISDAFNSVNPATPIVTALDNSTAR